MASLTLTRMAEGGIYDQLGGGFARYSVDESWTIPHFEKMLYDNAQLLGIYAAAAAVTGEQAVRAHRRRDRRLGAARHARAGKAASIRASTQTRKDTRASSMSGRPPKCVTD